MAESGLITVIVAGLLGILGALLGSLVTSRAIARGQDRAAQLAREGTQRQEFRAAITEFCTALMIYRGAELDLWEARHGGPWDLPVVRARAYETRTAARDGLYRVELSIASPAISEAVRAAFKVAMSIKDAQTNADLQLRRGQTEVELGQVVLLAREALGVGDV